MRLLTELHGHLNTVGSVAFSSSGEYLASAGCGHDRSVRVWKRPAWELNVELPMRAAGPVVAHPKEEYFALPVEGAVQFCRFADGSVIREFVLFPRRITKLDFSPDGELLCAATGHGWEEESDELVVVESQSGTSLLPGGIRVGETLAATFMPDGRSIVTATYAGRLNLWDVFTGQLLATANNPKSILSIAVLPDGNVAVSSCWEPLLRILSPREGAVLASIDVSTSATAGPVAASPDGQLIATAAFDWISIWSYPDLALVARVQNPHTDGAQDICFCPTRPLVATCGGTAVANWEHYRHTASPIRLWTIA